MSASALSAVQLAPRAPGCSVPLTASQLYAWCNLVNRGKQRSKLRLCAASLRLLGPLDVNRLQSAIESVVHRHESLRTRIVGSPEEPRQLVDIPLTFELSVEDLSNTTLDRSEDFVRSAAGEFISEEIDLAVGPLFAARLFKLSREYHVLVLGVDHFISDAASFSILTREILTLFREGVASETHSLPRLSVQFPDFAVWQAATQEAWAQHHAPYWRNRFANAEKTLLPLDCARPSSGYPEGECQFLHIPFGKAVSGTLADIARREGTLTPLVVLSIQLVIMSTWCQKRALLVAFLSHGRKGLLALKSMIGFLAYPMFLSLDVIPAETFQELVRRVTEEFHTALEHDASRAVGNSATEQLTELYFNWVQADLSPQWNSLGPKIDLGMRPFPITRSLKTTFAPHYFSTASGVLADIWYGRDLFENSTLEWFENGLRSIAREVARNPAARIGSLQSRCLRQAG